jgi:hypothetical protein
MRECGCERGDACTKTTVCGIGAAVEDAVETLGYELDIYWEFYQASKNLRQLQEMSVCCPISAKDFKKAEAWVEEAYRMVDEWENDK